MNKKKSITQFFLWVFPCVFIFIACTNSPKAKFAGTDITGIEITSDAKLIDQYGQLKGLKDFKGNIVILFFGFTSCPDICPTTLSKLKHVRERLGNKGDRLKIVFVSLDPDRDTPNVLNGYLSNFGSGFEGLTGDPIEIDKFAKAFKIFYQKSGNLNENYTIDHFAGSYMLDSSGRPRVLLSHSQSVDHIIHDFHQIDNNG